MLITDVYYRQNRGSLRRENRSSIFFCIHLLSKAMYHCNWAPTWATNITLFFTRIFKLKSIDWSAGFVPPSLTTISDCYSCQLWGRPPHIPLKKKFKIADSKTAIPSYCHASSFPQRNLLFWATLKGVKVPEHNWASCEASESSHPTWVTENYLQPSKEFCCSEKKEVSSGFSQF